MVRADADVLERLGGGGVADAGAPTVGVLVVGPAVEVGVFVGVGVPGVEDGLAVAQEAAEMAQQLPVGSGSEGNGVVLAVSGEEERWSARG
ncbi:hypothetical protein [Streptomyces sp. NPDC000877]|uniref:hypothetical protein n=1 Tax=unclassified Streptomyces TaxID=2593676 RepID=UPI00333108B4